VASSVSCAADARNRQLDYWVDNWKIGAEGSSGNAYSTVTLRQGTYISAGLAFPPLFKEKLRLCNFRGRWLILRLLK
jgi:hypothetical protein